MNRQEFIETLRQRLTEEGFPSTYIEQQCDTLTENLMSLPEDTEAQYVNERNIDIIVRKLISQDGNLIEVTTPTVKEATEEITPDSSEADVPANTADAADDGEATVAPDGAEAAPIDESAETAVEADDQDDLSVKAPASNSRPAKRAVPIAEYTPCDKPRLLTLLLVLICAPTLILFLTSALGLFAGVFLALAASIFVIVIAIIGIVGVGSVLSLASLLYGATQILSSPRYVGFHEIGFGLIVAGATMASSILLYNLAIRWIPFISEQMGKLFKLFFRKLISFAKNAVKGCEQL